MLQEQRYRLMEGIRRFKEGWDEGDQRGGYVTCSSDSRSGCDID